MAKMTVAGSALVIRSGVKLEDIKTIAKYRPKALILMGGEDGKEPVFAVNVSGREGVGGSINCNGATFAGTTYDPEGFATITVSLEGAKGDIREYIADKYGAAVANLNKLEAALPAVVEAITTEKQAVMDGITVA